MREAISIPKTHCRPRDPPQRIPLPILELKIVWLKEPVADNQERYRAGSDYVPCATIQLMPWLRSVS